MKNGFLGKQISGICYVDYCSVSFTSQYSTITASLFLLVRLPDLAPQEEALDGSLDQGPSHEEYPEDEVGVGVDGEVQIELEQDEGHQAVREPEEGEGRADGL